VNNTKLPSPPREPKEPDVVPLDDPNVPESLVPIPPKKPGFWKSLGQAVGELLGNVVYRGPK
jgi:hypothetical protein